MRNIAGLFFCMLFCSRVWAVTLYVDLGNSTPSAPYDSWETAASSIQTALNASSEGDLILIADGHYLLSSYITVSKAVTLRSVSGPDAVIIDGQGSVRCFRVSAATACVIDGLTITNGNAGIYPGGGVRCEDATPVITNCVIVGNSAERGGGMSNGTANGCTISGNTVSAYGGGLYSSTANGCTISGNTASSYGGGLYSATVNDCSISGNSAPKGGGMAFGTVTGSSISNNVASSEGGGLYSSSAEGCAIIGNSAGDYGGGMRSGSANNCLISENTSTNYGGGTYSVALTSCTVRENTAQYGGGTCFGSVEGGSIEANTASAQGGGVYSGSASGCTISGNSSPYGGGMRSGVATECVISGNSADYSGGGMYEVAATLCTISGNTAQYGGGIYEVAATNCTLRGNSAATGGGMYKGSAVGCVIRENVASSNGGGGHSATVEGCSVQGNSAQFGGGLFSCSATHCAVNGNSSDSSGGGFYEVTATNCTVAGNAALSGGGGMYLGSAYNCIIWHNEAGVGDNDLNSVTALYSCSPDLTQGVSGNITSDPLMISWSHLEASSPCRGAGSSAYTVGTDIDGETWKNPPSMGCDEYNGSVTGALTVNFAANSEVSAFLPLTCSEQTVGAVSRLIWDFGGGVLVTNAPEVEHTWNVPGSYDVILTAYNETWPDGVSSTQTISVVPAEGMVIYVSPQGNDSNDGFGWSTAKATIQAGIAAQQYEDGVVLVSNGVYALSSEILVDKQIVVRGFNGSESTVVNGQGSVRCFYLDDPNCVIEGLTLTNGYTASLGGGVYCSGNDSLITNCVIVGNSAQHGGGIFNGTASHCSIDGNTASGSSGQGGGAYGALLSDCVVRGNAAEYGGGIRSGTVTDCEVRGNTASASGGGMYEAIASNCIISGNSASNGGGLYKGTANCCLIHGNSAEFGGGLFSGSSTGCAISGNLAEQSGGGLYDVAATNCTVGGNLAQSDGGVGGMHKGSAYNCIVWYNEAPLANDLYEVAAVYSCSPDLTQGGDGNLTSEPSLISWSHLAANSPCRAAGSSAYTVGTDIDGELWQNPPSMGCDEYGSIAGDLSVDFAANSEVSAFLPLAFSEQAAGALSLLVWDFGDGVLVTNSPGVEHTWNVPGSYDVILTAYNETWPDGVSTTQTISVLTAEGLVIYVAPQGNDSNDGFSWSTAKSSIQAGIDAQLYDGGVIMVSNGVYALSSGILVDKPVSVRGYDGPDSTLIDGLGSVRCFYLEDSGCALDGLTLTNGYSDGNGGGIYCASSDIVITDCSIVGCSSQFGGGIFGGTASSCVIAGNTASEQGGGVYDTALTDCLVRGNSAQHGGGLRSGTATRCEISGNTVSGQGGGAYDAALSDCSVYGNAAALGGGLCFGSATHCDVSENTATASGGGFNDAAATDCAISGNSAEYGGGLYNGTASACAISNNIASLEGGGLYSVGAENCSVIGNSAGTYGGGMRSGSAVNCTISGNASSQSGGGVYVGTVSGCTICGNSALNGGGVSFATVESCTISENSADEYGGGVYSGSVTNCTISGNSAHDGGGMSYGVLNNCTISQNSAEYSGGGIFDVAATNCVVSGNQAEFGGGARSGTANNCVVSDNSAEQSGGGTYEVAAINCTISGNSAQSAGGMYAGSADNCIVWYNDASSAVDLYDTTARYTCSPDVTQGETGNITRTPYFVDRDNGDYRLASNSSCINRGNNAVVSGSLDLDGNLRIFGDVVDLGAYEYQSLVTVSDWDEDGLPDEWEQDCFSSLDETADGDADGDGASNIDEYIAGTNPADSGSLLAVSGIYTTGGFELEWSPCVTGRWYTVQWMGSLGDDDQSLQNHLEYPQNSYTDIVHNAESSGYYRVEVQMK